MISRIIWREYDAGAGANLRWLILGGLAIWVTAYASLNFGLLTNPIDHPSERILRRIVTCTAGFLLCLAMAPFLWRARSRPLAERIGIALGVSACAYLAHLIVRLCVFHLYRPLWGPLDFEVVLTGLQGADWTFALWAALCLLLFGETRSAAPCQDPPSAPFPDSATFWSGEGRWRVKVPLDEVLLFEAERDYVRLHVPGKHYLVRGRLKDLAAGLPNDRYLQVHRSAIVRLAAIEGIQRAGSAWRVRLRTGLEARVSRPMGKVVRQKLAAEASGGESG
ncbi:LytTR family DNA-binding domain-containing protein [Sphingosinicella sp. LHD-64]|uniref:LytTR family DNA-binding domain-containing protein n=1 Tax=Sphingosinicella sp. LHD-64 TaxID=3072139 RepID=UPI00280E3E73|nr:LytTR family DNA-binding domain-containing protein [Sphingosinicella sp. LHD-64]MDQ8756202.1 LytTR family DNA-binding domain-containing protein [Sphingosinicella sp. LHD-64]